MEEEKDNPFRPDGELSHMVEPIVETYKSLPYSSIQHDGHNASHHDGVTSQASSKTKGKKDSKEKGKSKESQGKSKESQDKAKESQSKSTSGEGPVKPSDIGIQLQDGQAQKRILSSPRAGTVELVHLEEKK